MSHEPCPCPSCVAQQRYNPLSWIVLTPSAETELLAIHVIPDDDTAKHEINDEGNCACNPAIDDQADDLLYVHNAFDRRENYARGFLKPH